MGKKVAASVIVVFVLCIFPTTLVQAQVVCTLDSNPGTPVDAELTIDDMSPYGIAGGPVSFPAAPDANPPEPGHGTVLRAAVGDLNKDGFRDIVLGGNGPEWQSVNVHYLSGPPNWTILHTEELQFFDLPSGKGTSSCYDLELALVNDDDWDDIVVGRLLNLPEVELFSFVDTVFINAGTGGVGGDQFLFSDARPIPNPSVVPNFMDGTANTGATFGVALGEIDNVPGVDLLLSGSNYDVRYYQGDGILGDFTYKKTYSDGLEGRCRDVLLGDVDNDGDLDLVVSRFNVNPDAATMDVPNRVWFNQRNLGTGFNPADPFVKSTQPALKWPPLDQITWTSTTCTPSTGATPTNGQTFESALADLDGDGDLDLVIASHIGANGAYLNNGLGFFGCLDAPTLDFPQNNGEPAYVFPPVTPSWTGSGSECMLAFVTQIFEDRDIMTPPIDLACPDYTFTIPGSYLNSCTGVTTADLNGDHLPEVGFSNRGDPEEVCITGFELPYLNDPPAPPVPQVFDFIFFNESTPGNLSFAPCAELIGKADDGTGYAELVDVNRDRRPDWLDANFQNELQQKVNKLYWGGALGITTCAEILPQALTGVPASLTLQVGDEFAGLPFQILASATGDTGVLPFFGAEVPLTPDALTSLLAGVQGLYPGAIGLIGPLGEAQIELVLPLEVSLLGSTIWFSAVVAEGDQAVVVSNPVQAEVAY